MPCRCASAGNCWSACWLGRDFRLTAGPDVRRRREAPRGGRAARTGGGRLEASGRALPVRREQGLGQVKTASGELRTGIGGDCLRSGSSRIAAGRGAWCSSNSLCRSYAIGPSLLSNSYASEITFKGHRSFTEEIVVMSLHLVLGAGYLPRRDLQFYGPVPSAISRCLLMMFWPTVFLAAAISWWFS